MGEASSKGATERRRLNERSSDLRVCARERAEISQSPRARVTRAAAAANHSLESFEAFEALDALQAVVVQVEFLQLFQVAERPDGLFPFGARPLFVRKVGLLLGGVVVVVRVLVDVVAPLIMLDAARGRDPGQGVACFGGRRRERRIGMVKERREEVLPERDALSG